MLQSFYFIVGLTGLVLGAELLVRGATKLALSWRISPLVIGLTVVAFGTSAPEMAVSTGAALSGQTDLALGNVIGSNTFNVLFILGVSALITPLFVHTQLIRQEVPIMVGASLLLLLVAQDGRIGVADSAMLMALMIAYTVFLVRQSRSQPQAAVDEFAAEMPDLGAGRWDSRWPGQVSLIVAGLVLLVAGADALVDAAVHFARSFGISELVIGLTIVAAGTSLPEVAASVTAALKGERDIAVGNVVGSCVFNILACVGLAGLAAAAAGVGDLAVPASALRFDLWVMLAVAVACLPVFISGGEIARWEGGLFLAYYASYVAYLLLAAQQHAALPAFSATMLSFVLPLTVLTLIVGVLRRKPD